MKLKTKFLPLVGLGAVCATAMPLALTSCKGNNEDSDWVNCNEKYTPTIKRYEPEDDNYYWSQADEVTPTAKYCEAVSGDEGNKHIFEQDFYWYQSMYNEVSKSGNNAIISYYTKDGEGNWDGTGWYANKHYTFDNVTVNNYKVNFESIEEKQLVSTKLTPLSKYYIINFSYDYEIEYDYTIDYTINYYISEYSDPSITFKASEEGTFKTSGSVEYVDVPILLSGVYDEDLEIILWYMIMDEDAISYAWEHDIDLNWNIYDKGSEEYTYDLEFPWGTIKDGNSEDYNDHYDWTNVEEEMGSIHNYFYTITASYHLFNIYPLDFTIDEKEEWGTAEVA